MNLTGNKILITGGASGIGFALVERFSQEGNTIIICGRRQDALDEAQQKNPSWITRVADASTEEGRTALVEWVMKEHPDTNVLVNNAGIQNWMKIDEPDYYTRAKAELAINVEAPLHLTQLFLQSKAINTIINVTSGLSFTPLTKTPVYSATKAFLHSYTRSLRHLLHDRGIEVIELIPPALNTDLGGKGIHDFAPPVSGFIDTTFDQLKAGKPQVTYMFSEAMLKAGQEEREIAFGRLNEK